MLSTRGSEYISKVLGIGRQMSQHNSDDNPTPIFGPDGEPMPPSGSPSKVKAVRQKAADRWKIIEPGLDSAGKGARNLTAIVTCLTVSVPALLVGGWAVWSWMSSPDELLSDRDIAVLDTAGVHIDIDASPANVVVANTAIGEPEVGAVSTVLAKLTDGLNANVEASSLKDLTFLNGTKVVHLTASNNSRLTTLWKPSSVRGLEIFAARSDPLLSTLRSCAGMNTLETIDATACGVVELNSMGGTLKKREQLPKLSALTLDQCPSLNLNMPDEWSPPNQSETCPSLKRLSVRACANVSDLSWLVNCPTLEHVDVTGCEKLDSLKTLPVTNSGTSTTSSSAMTGIRIHIA